MKKLLVLSILSTVSTAVFAEKIGYVDTQALFLKYSQTKILKAKLTKEKTKLEEALKKQEIEVQKLQVELQGKGSKVTDNEKKIFETKVRELRKSFEESQKKLSAEETKKLQEIEKLISVTIKAIAKKEQLDYVFEQGAIRYGGVDITSKVLSAMENSKKIN